MTDLENYMLVEMLFQDFSKDVFPEETNALKKLKENLSDKFVTVSSFSLRKLVGACLLTFMGLLNYLLFYNAGKIVVITYLPYKQFAGYPALFVGLLLLIYQIFSTREFYILNHKERYYFGEKTSLGSFQRLQFFSFKKKDVKQMVLGNCQVSYEISIFFVCWWIIWFYFREGIISLRNYAYLGYPLLLRVGILLILTAVIFAGTFISWTVPVGRSQLKITLSGSYVEFNFNELVLEDAEKIRKILDLPEIPHYENTIPEKAERRFFIKSDNKEGPGILNYNLLWRHFYIGFGILLTLMGFILLFIDLYENFSLGMFLEVFVGFFGIKFIIYGCSEHFYQNNYQMDERKIGDYSAQIMTYQRNAVYGFRIGFSELLYDDEVEIDKQEKKAIGNDREKKEKEIKQKQLPDTQRVVYPFTVRQKSNFKPISIFNIVLMGVSYYYLLYQSCKVFSPYQFYRDYLFYPIWLYWFMASLVIIPTALVFLKSDLPSWKGNSRDVMAIIKHSKNPVKKELIIRLIILAGMVFIPIILTIAGVPFMF